MYIYIFFYFVRAFRASISCRIPTDGTLGAEPKFLFVFYIGPPDAMLHLGATHKYKSFEVAQFRGFWDELS